MHMRKMDLDPGKLMFGPSYVFVIIRWLDCGAAAHPPAYHTSRVETAIHPKGPKYFISQMA